MKRFKVTVTTSTQRTTYTAIARTSFDAFADAADAQGDTPCAITVMPAGAQ